MAEERRRLAAIMFTDMVGYSALAQADEAAALAVLAQHNRLLRPIFRKFHGHEVKTVGDAFLVEFDSALEATRCALEVQRTLHDHNVALPDERRIRIRIGIHVGDVVQTNGDVLGDAVNIASRIEPLADPDGICLTQQVYDQVQNKIPSPMVRLPPASLKNIRYPVAVYRVVPPWSSPPPAPRAGGSAAGHHLAVLPLTNISPDPKDEYFADGLTDELISVLSQVRDLDVIARTSVMPYKAAPKSIAQIGAELSVDTVLEGSVRKAGNQLRITLQLIDVATQGHIWASSYNREFDDVFAVQTDIAERTAQALQLEFSKDRAHGPERRPTADLVAYDLYLRGLVAARKPYGGGNDEAVRCFEEATRRDPTFAEAYAAWADFYVEKAGDSLPMRKVIPRARELASRALELDPYGSDAHSALANIAFQFDQDWELAEREFRTAIALNASNVSAHRFFGLMLLALDRIDESKDELRRVVRLDPGGSGRFTLALAELLDGNFDATISLAEDELRSNPSVGSHVYLGIFLVSVGRKAEALREADVPLTGANDDVRFDHALLNALVGRPEAARGIIAEVERGEAKSYTSETHLAILYSALGEKAKALDLLEKEYREGDRVLWLYYRSVWFDSIRDDPRFTALVRRYGLPSERVRGPPRRPQGTVG